MWERRDNFAPWVLRDSIKGNTGLVKQTVSPKRFQRNLLSGDPKFANSIMEIPQPAPESSEAPIRIPVLSILERGLKKKVIQNIDGQRERRITIVGTNTVFICVTHRGRY